MITVEESQLQEQLAVDEITFAIPAQSFGISCAISAEETLPVVTEFALRIAYVCGSLSPAQIQDFFGFSNKEVDAVIQALLSERLIKWNEEHLELTNYALTRFQDSSDNLPRFFKIQDWSAEVVFDLISFSPAARPSRIRRVRSQVELATRNFDKQSRTLQFAEQSFQQNFRQICTKEKAEIYKISAIDPGERFSIPLSCTFHLDLDGQMSVVRSIDDKSFGSRLEISESITDALANQERGSNESLREFIRIFDDKLLGRYVSDDTFDLRRYVQQIHLTKLGGYDDDRVMPLLGALHLPSNTELLLDRIQAELKRADQAESEDLDVCEDPEDRDGKVKPKLNWDALWCAPKSTLWARSRSARQLAQKLDRSLMPHSDGASPQRGGLRVLLPVEQGAPRERLATYVDQFPRLYAGKFSLMEGNLEVLLIPGCLVCALFHFHLAHQSITIPIGFLSSHPDHLRTITALLSRQISMRPDTISVMKEEGGSAAVQDLLALVDRLSNSSEVVTPTRSGRPLLSLKKTL
ncbi:hypothetical protein ACN1C3_28290 [Pseudomonas sp. H11T01]|uniref:hypothetical protein n=1 Tax=Pseudomonas sp. H11T01 TaxID=3402749 RepID=UPI003AC75F8E